MQTIFDQLVAGSAELNRMQSEIRAIVAIISGVLNISPGDFVGKLLGCYEAPYGTWRFYPPTEDSPNWDFDFTRQRFPSCMDRCLKNLPAGDIQLTYDDLRHLVDEHLSKVPLFMERAKPYLDVERKRI